MSTITHSNATNTASEKNSAEPRERLSDEAKNLKSDLIDVKDDVAGVTKAATELCRSEAEHIGEFATTGVDKAKEYHTSVCKQVSRHPTAAVLTSVGVGILIGRILGGR